MALADARGLCTSTTNPASLERYERSLALLHGYYGDPLSLIDEALEEDPAFMLGHALRAVLLITASDSYVEPLLRESVEKGEKLMDTATDRERRHLFAARAWLQRDFDKSIRLYGDIAVDYPRDSLALQVAHIGDFLLGQSTLLRDRIARALPAWSEEDPEFGYLLGMYSFGLEETNLFEAAEEHGRRALALNRRDPWAVHAVAHVMEMQGRQADGIRWLTSRQEDWAPDNMFAIHNWWHLALFHLDEDAIADVLRLYDEHIRADRSDMALNLIDASALLWRLHLRGVDSTHRWEELADAWEQRKADGYYAFNDVHALMAYLGAGRYTLGEELIATLEAAARGSGVNAMMSGDVGLPMARGFMAFERGNYDEAVSQLLDLRLKAHRFGGSHAQRDIIDLTLMEAAFRGGFINLARALAAERLALKPKSQGNQYLNQRATAL